MSANHSISHPRSPAQSSLQSSVQPAAHSPADGNPPSAKGTPVTLTGNATQIIFERGEQGALWRIVEGHVCVENDDGKSRQLIQIAKPGDYVGLEALMELPYQCTATALTPVKLERVDVHGVEARTALLQQVVLQQGERMVDMARLRTGTVAMRLSNLLMLLGHPIAGRWPTDGKWSPLAKLPTLREMARVIDAKHETVCRVLQQLIPSRGRSGANEESYSAGGRPAAAGDLACLAA